LFPVVSSAVDFTVDFAPRWCSLSGAFKATTLCLDQSMNEIAGHESFQNLSYKRLRFFIWIRQTGTEAIKKAEIKKPQVCLRLYYDS
jgi:hypothetical protein